MNEWTIVIKPVDQSTQTRDPKLTRISYKNIRINPYLWCTIEKCSLYNLPRTVKFKKKIKTQRVMDAINKPVNYMNLMR